MKNKFLQWGIALIVLLGIVFLVTYMTQYAPSPSPGDRSTPPPPLKLPLRFGKVTAGIDRPGGILCEVNQPYHYDFWFDNTEDKPIAVGVKATTCKCTMVEVCVVPPAEKARIHRDHATLVAAFLLPFAHLHPAPGLLLGPTSVCRINVENRLDAGRQWQLLKKKNLERKADELFTATVPANAGGWVRMTWDYSGERNKPNTLESDIWMEDQEHGPTVRLGVPFVAVDPFQVWPNAIDVGIFDEKRSEHSGNIFCWSLLRHKFSLTAEALKDPFVRCGEPQPLTRAEQRVIFLQYAKQMAGEDKVDPALEYNLPSMTGYRIPVTIVERAGNQELDLGRFERVVFIKPEGMAEPMAVQIHGAVRGDLVIGDPAERDRVWLRIFNSEFGTKVSVPISTDQLGLDLELEKAPDYLKVQLTGPDKGRITKRWQLIVEVEPGKVVGDVPADAAIYLKTKSTPPRRIRILVIGTGVQSGRN